MPTIGNLNAIVTATTSQFDKAMSASRKRLELFGSKMLDVGRTVARVGGITAALGGSLFFLIQRTARSIDEQAKFAQLIGETTEKMAGLRLAAELTGVPINALQMGLQRMTRRLGQAADGAGEAIGALQTLGLDAKELVKASPADQFARIAEAVGKIGDRERQIAVFQKLFDSEGVALLRTASLGAKGLADVQRQAESLGIAFDEDLSKKAAGFNDQLTILKTSFTGFATELVDSGVLTDLTRVLQSLTEAMRAAKDAGLVDFVGWYLGLAAEGVLTLAEAAEGAKAVITSGTAAATTTPLPSQREFMDRQQDIQAERNARNLQRIADQTVHGTIAPGR